MGIANRYVMPYLRNKGFFFQSKALKFKELNA